MSTTNMESIDIEIQNNTIQTSQSTNDNSISVFEFIAFAIIFIFFGPLGFAQLTIGMMQHSNDSCESFMCITTWLILIGTSSILFIILFGITIFIYPDHRYENLSNFEILTKIILCFNIFVFIFLIFIGITLWILVDNISNDVNIITKITILFYITCFAIFKFVKDQT